MKSPDLSKVLDYAESQVMTASDCEAIVTFLHRMAATSKSAAQREAFTELAARAAHNHEFCARVAALVELMVEANPEWIKH